LCAGTSLYEKEKEAAAKPETETDTETEKETDTNIDQVNSLAFVIADALLPNAVSQWKNRFQRP